MPMARCPDVDIGSLVQARDPAGFWYNAKVIRKIGRGARSKVTVRYIGFASSHDEVFVCWSDPD